MNDVRFAVLPSVTVKVAFLWGKWYPEQGGSTFLTAYLSIRFHIQKESNLPK
jgi:hypothetical protein